MSSIKNTTKSIAIEISYAREAAHAKHGENSIESVDFKDLRWLSILGEEFGEVCHSLTYDSSEDIHDLRNELIDVATVAIAWIAAIERGLK